MNVRFIVVIAWSNLPLSLPFDMQINIGAMSVQPRASRVSSHPYLRATRRKVCETHLAPNAGKRWAQILKSQLHPIHHAKMYVVSATGERHCVSEKFIIKNHLSQKTLTLWFHRHALHIWSKQLLGVRVCVNNEGATKSEEVSTHP